MSAYYEWYDSPCSLREQAEGKTPRPYARIVRSVTHDTKALTDEISKRCTLTAADIKAVLQAASEAIRAHLAEGNRVHLDGLGSFYVSLRCKPEEGKKITARQVHFGQVHFLPEVPLKQYLNGMSLCLNPHPLPHNTRNEEERRNLLKRLLREKGFLTLREYRQATGLSGYRATIDVQSWQAEGWLGRKGSRNYYWYCLKQQD